MLEPFITPWLWSYHYHVLHLLPNFSIMNLYYRYVSTKCSRTPIRTVKNPVRRGTPTHSSAPRHSALLQPIPIPVVVWQPQKDSFDNKNENKNDDILHV